MGFRLLSLAVLLVLSLVSTDSVRAQSGEEQRLRQLVDTAFYGRRGMAKNKLVVGISVGIYWKGRSYFYSCGYADREKKIPADSATLFEIGSNTKLFTALLLANEIVSGRMKADACVDGFVPVHPSIRNKIRLVDLADYTSGLPTLHDSESFARLGLAETEEAFDSTSTETLLRALQQVSSLEDYGHYAYSNFSFAILGAILSRKAHVPYEQLLRTTLFTPLRLPSMTCTADTTDERVARGYSEKKRAKPMQLHGFAPAGSISSNAADLLRFLRLQMELSGPLKEAMQLTQKTFYEDSNIATGLGWHKMVRYDHDVWMMRGDTYGQSSLLSFSRADSLGIVILYNSDNPKLVQRLYHNLFVDIIEQDPAYLQAYHNRPALVLPQERLQAFQGRYSGRDMGLSFDVRKIGDSLAITLVGQQPVMTYPVSPSLFYCRGVLASFEFLQESEGRFSKMVLRQNGQRIEVEREEKGEGR